MLVNTDIPGSIFRFKREFYTFEEIFDMLDKYERSEVKDRQNAR